MNKYWLALALTLITPQVFAQVSAEMALPGCKKLITDAEMDTEQAFCMGWVDAAVKTAAIHAGHLGDNKGMAFCLPADASFQQVIKVIIKGLEDDPASLHKDFGVLATVHLSLSFPCEAKAKGVQS